jgi:predicted ATPase/class 3 adenylate cyclase
MEPGRQADCEDAGVRDGREVRHARDEEGVRDGRSERDERGERDVREQHHVRDERSVRPAERTETYLFTDIEGSTRLLQRLGERFSDLLVEQRRLVLDAAKRHGGVERGTAGDGSFVVFGSARSAVLAAAEAQQGLARHDWPDGATVRVRMGMHSGESPVADDIYAGLDVYRAARIAAAAHGGQVLLSDVTSRLVERDLPDDLTLLDLGAHALKDLDHPERIWQLQIAGLVDTFPGLKSVEARPGNLPVDPGPLIGRAADVARLAKLLEDETTRLVTLTGPGGVGKTRLATEVAKSVAAAFPDGAYFVSLATLSDPSGIPERIVETLALADRGSRTPVDILEAHLRSKRILLVLDNVEQVVAGADVIARLLSTCPGLKVVATSRIVLRLSFENEVPVPPLAVPDVSSAVPVERLVEFPAVALFVQRARAVRPDFTLTEENAAVVARICWDLDGLPLAIELAAARIKLFSPQAMLARLGRRLDLLKGGAVDRPVRQQTLRRTIAWSCDLLDADERAYFRRLATFVGGFTFDAVDAVCNASNDLELDAEDALARLLDNSLLRIAEDAGDEPRFAMLATIREYAVELLDGAPEAHDVRGAHAAYYLNLAEEAAPHLTGRDQGSWLQRLERERGNFEVALDWLGASGAHVEALRLGAALWRYWVSRGPLREGGERLRDLLSLPGGQERNAVRAKALHGAGTIFAERGDFALAQRNLEEAIGIWRDLEDQAGLATSLNSLAWAALLNGDAPRTEALAHEAIPLTRGLGDVRGESVAHYNLGQAAMARGDLRAAHDLVVQAAELRRRTGDRRGVAYMDVSLAYNEELQGRYDAALAHVEAGHAVLRELGDTQIGAWATQIRGRIRLGLGDGEGALRYLHEARALWFASGNLDALARTIADIAEAELAAGAITEAAAAARESLAIVREIGGLGAFTPVLPLAASVALAEGDVEQAEVLIGEARAIAKRLGARLLEAETLDVEAQLAYHRNDLAAVVRAAARAAALRERIGAAVRFEAARRQGEMLDSVRGALGAAEFTALWKSARDGAD